MLSDSTWSGSSQNVHREEQTEQARLLMWVSFRSARAHWTPNEEQVLFIPSSQMASQRVLLLNKGKVGYQR